MAACAHVEDADVGRDSGRQFLAAITALFHATGRRSARLVQALTDFVHDIRARAPTERTVRRWWQDRRWLTPPVAYLAV